MVLCPPFRWSSKGGFSLNKVQRTHPARPTRRETIAIFPEALGEFSSRSNGEITNGYSPAPNKISSLSAVDPSVIEDIKKTSAVSQQSRESRSSHMDADSGVVDDRKSSAGRKTIADLVRIDPNKQERKRRAVIAPPVTVDASDLQYDKFEKDQRSAAQISKAVMANDFLRNLMDEERLKAVVEAMSSQDCPAGSLIIREGESGSHLYVSAHGQFEVLKGGQVVGAFGAGEAFGELAILYKAKRFASIRCITEAKVWTLERRVFQKIMVRSGRQEQEDNVRFLASVPLLQGIHPIELTKISGFLKREFFSAGTAVVRQGDRGDKFYIIRGGTVVVTKREGDAGENRVGTLRRGDYFGEQALLHEDRRLATVTAQPPGVECLTLERGPFTELLGDLDELRLKRHTVPRPSQQSKTSQVRSEFEYVELKDLEIVGTMGVGGFGRVELVQYRPDKTITFALKCLKKIDMVQQQQQEHACWCSVAHAQHGGGVRARRRGLRGARAVRGAARAAPVLRHHLRSAHLLLRAWTPLDGSSEVTLQEFFSNGYVMLLVVTLALVFQALLSQNSTHLVTVEGTRLKTGLQGMLFDKCMRLAPWSSNDNNGDEESPLLHAPEDSSATPSGVLTNLMSQDTYNIMSCVWICHYLWAIPLKVAVILYLLYTKLGVSAIIGTAVSVLFITPLQFYIGKKISDNSKDISKCTDHRISKITEILQGMNVIKLYVWEDLFKEKILNLREVELKLLNKDSIYWSFLTFTTQVSTVLVTVITFLAYYFLNDSKGLTAVNVFAGLALFNQLTVPLLILPVTVLMMIQAMVSTNRIKDFLELPESNNVREDCLSENSRKPSDIFNDAFVDNVPDDNSMVEDGVKDVVDAEDQFSDDENCGISSNQEYVVRFRNAAFSWGMKNDMLLEVDDLDIPAGKLIMVVGTSGAGKSSLLSAMLGEMFLERGDVTYNGRCTTWYAGQPPWLVEGSVRDNIVMGSPWCQRRYGRVLRAAALRPDLQLLPEGDATRLGSHGAPLSGGQRVRVCIARALYSGARLLALDEPLAALDAPLARHVVARALVPAARAGRTVVVATNRLELLHYADLVIAMEEGRVSGVGRAGAGVCPGGAGAAGAVSRWARLAAEARAAAARAGAGPPGGAARERTRLMRELTRARFQRCNSDDTMVGICEAAGAHLLAEVPTRAGGSWRRAARQRPALERQLSSPPPSVHNYKWRREVRRAVSADASNAALQREASLLRRLLRPRPHRTLARWTPRTLRRLLSSDSETTTEENIPNGVVDESALETAYTSLTSNGTETSTVVIQEETPNKPETDEPATEGGATCEYARACGWWGRAYWAAAAAAQALALLADYWLTRATAKNAQAPLTDEEMWWSVRSYAGWCLCVVVCGGLAQCTGGAAGARARRALHERLLHAALHAPLHHHRSAAPAALLHRFSADVQVIDRKLPIAVSRWGQLALLCVAALLVNAIASPWSLLALLPAVALYFTLQSVYLSNARELQRTEALSAASVVALAAETSAGGGAVRAGRLQPHMRAALLARLDVNNNALLLLNAANRWLGLTLDLVGAATVCVSIGMALHGGGGGAVAGLAGAYSLLLPAYLAHLAKCRADLDLQLAAVERVRADTNVPQEDYREDCAIPSGWQRNGKMDFENVNIQHDPDSQPILNNINISIAPGEKVAVCGRSGSGKSTLVLTCAGATTIRSGRLLIDGADATQVPLRALRHRVVVLPQEAMMFSGTLRENLDPLGVHTDEEIWQSLRAVGLQDFVTAQPAGLEGGVGRGGCSWSGGRAARACAARAALHARLAGALVLDEPAAALDAPAERALLAALAAAAPNTTIITVAHRISSVRGYDRAVVLDEGRVVEQGAVGALLAQPASRLARMLAAHRSP